MTATRITAPLGVLALAFSIASCTDKPGEREVPGPSNSAQVGSEVLWAMNIGGGEHLGVDGTRYLADSLSTGESGTIPQIKGSQDPALFRTYREGAIEINLPIDNGSYDLTFKFAEPFDIPTGSRVFDAYAEEKTVIHALDIRNARDGNHHADLVRTVTGVEVTDGTLDIRFRAAIGKPVLSAVVVRRRSQRANHWNLVWSDEFDYEGKPDPDKWTHDIWRARRVNDEDQAYTGRLKNVMVRDGKLLITAYREDYDDARYTSGRIQSSGKGDLLYGRVDVRARLPAGKGTWAAIWMMPSDPFTYATNCDEVTGWEGVCDAWPNSGEIDIMEHVGYDMQTVHGTVHSKAYYWKNGKQRKASIEGRTVDSEFHVYSMEWSPEHISILFDGVPYFYYANEHAGWESWPFDHPFHVILNLAIGGGWGRAGGGIDDRIFPVTMEIDYVRMFERAN